MKQVSISGSLRENVGKKDAKLNRKQGKIPCVLYGGKEQIHFSTEEASFKDVIYTPEACTVVLNIGEKSINAILQEVQYHPVVDNIIHADFLEIFPEKPVTIHIPIKIVGVSPGILKGGRLVQKLRKLKVKALPGNLPDNIMIDISKLEIGDSVKVVDVKQKDLLFLETPNSLIVTVKTTRVAVEETPVAGAAAPAAEAAKA